jgi:hypothetical protein
MKPNKTIPLVRSLFVTGLCIALFSIIGCEKTAETPESTEDATTSRRPPSPPVYYYFTNCTGPTFSSSFSAGAATTATAKLNYINAPGGSYPAFTSSTVNGLTVTAPAGTLNNGSGSITFTVSGTPVNPGNMTIPVSIKGSLTCNLPITVLNAPPVAGNCGEPAMTPGSKGCVTFTYRGQQVTYATVRAADGKAWLQQNIGSPQVAISANDIGSFGHYFQWGRWDDGHQVPTGPAVTGSPLLQNPSHIPSGNPNFIKGATALTAWWGTGGAASNTWSGTTATATNGKDPCIALGAGWHLPTAAEWTNVLNQEFISDATSAFDSRLKLTESGYRANATGAYTPNFVGGYYWSGSASAGNVGQHLFFDAAYNAFISVAERGYGFNCRCVKN